MKKNDVTYGQLERVLRGFGFTCRPGNRIPPGRIYEHKQTGAIVALPAFSETEKIYPHHLLTARMALDDFGIADPTTFDANLQKNGMTTSRSAGQCASADAPDACPFRRQTAPEKNGDMTHHLKPHRERSDWWGGHQGAWPTAVGQALLHFFGLFSHFLGGVGQQARGGV